MILKNRPIGIREAEVIEIRSMVGPERFHQASGFQRLQSRVFVEIQCAALDPRIAALVTLELGLGIHREPGVKRMQLGSAKELTDLLLAEILRHGKFGDGCSPAHASIPIISCPSPTQENTSEHHQTITYLQL
jgi:hypothetical protein